MPTDSLSSKNSRRNFLRTGVTATLATAVCPSLGSARVADSAPAPTVAVKDFELDEITIDDVQKALQFGQYSSRSLTEKYLARIQKIHKAGPMVNSVIELNPDALQIAEALDQERKSKGPRGPLHGIPGLIKDNIDTGDRMNTTGGSLALLGSRPANDAFVAAQLRAAGAVILGKTNLSEWANIRSSLSTSGWSCRAGLTRNLYALDRNPCGSSSGTGVAVSANLRGTRGGPWLLVSVDPCAPRGSSFYRGGAEAGPGDLSRLGLSSGALSGTLSGTTGPTGASGGWLGAGSNNAGLANSGSGSESGADCGCEGRIPLASTIDHRQSSSGPGVIPIFS